MLSYIGYKIKNSHIFQIFLFLVLQVRLLSMEVKVNDIKVSTKTLVPTLEVTIRIQHYAWFEMPISISGKINTADGKTCAYMSEYEVGYNHTFTIKPQEPLNEGNNFKGEYDVKLTSILTPLAIDHINTLREKDHQKAVRFLFDFIVKHQYLPSDKTIQTIIRRESERIVINQEVWLRDYAPALGIGNFLLLEVQIPNKHNVKPAWVKLYDRLYMRLTEMEDAIREGEWDDVMLAARQFYEGLKIGDGKAGHKTFEAGLRKAFKKDKHNDEGINDFLSAIQKLFNFFSKYIHEKDRNNKLKPLPEAQKEDAQVAFALAVSLLNLIGKKISRE